MDYIKLIIAGVILTIGFGIGFKVGDWSGEKARQALQEAVTKGNLSKQSLTDTVDALKADNAALSKHYESDMVLADLANKASEDRWVKLTAQQGATIASLKNDATLTRNSIISLQAKLAQATTPQEKKQIEDEITAESKSLDTVEAKSLGLQCLSAVVPDDYVALINGK